jgi:sulfotransferase family protein
MGGVAVSPLRDRVLFVEGSQRSGTTWLNTLLATHPEIAGSSVELHLFDKGVGRLFDNHDEWDAFQTGIAPVVSREQLVDLARDLCDGVLESLRSKTKPDARFVVEKTPTDFHAQTVMARKAEIYPDAWHLHIVRDGRAVAASLMRAPWIEDRSPEACARQWLEAVTAIRETVSGRERYREVTYEDLVADPVAVCRGIFGWLGIRDDADVLEQVRLSAAERAAAVEEAGRVGRREYAKARVRHLLRRAPAAPAPEGSLPERFAHAFRHRDLEGLRAVTTDDFELELRSGDGDLREGGEAARAALAQIAEAAFGKLAVAEQWSLATGTSFHTLRVSARLSDATRIDIVMLLTPRGSLIRQAIVVSAGSVSGRPLTQLSYEQNRVTT